MRLCCVGHHLSATAFIFILEDSVVATDDAADLEATSTDWGSSAVIAIINDNFIGESVP
jgi:hypothetical protein